MKFIICGGGTAGHITPGIAIAEEFRQKNSKNEILFIGRDGGSENEMIANAGFPYTTLNLCGLRRTMTIKNISALQKALTARKEAKKIISRFSPDAIIGTGGYVCWPVLMAGYSMKIPIFIHESNIYPGLTTKLLSRKCNKVFLYSDESVKHLPKKTEYSAVGNPVSKKFFKITRDEARHSLGLHKNDVFILSFGGSLGAERLNEVIINFMQDFSSKEANIHHLHATGKSNFSAELNNNFQKNTHCKIVPYIKEMPRYMKAADIVICRAGAMTLAELSASGVAAILIPSPNVSDNHQYKNAMALKEKNAAVLLPESELTKARLEEEIKTLINLPSKRLKLSKCIELFAKKDVEKRITEEVITVITAR